MRRAQGERCSPSRISRMLSSRMIVEPLGHEIVGAGPRRLIVLNDWLCDTSTWTAARVYLDRTRFTWAFTDLRGHGRSERASPNACRRAEQNTNVIAGSPR